MLRRIPGLAATLFLVLAGNALAAEQTLDSIKKMATPEAEAPKGRAVINFANMHGSIQDWRADGTKAILIESAGKKWYRAEFMNSCHNLPFAEQIGFITDGTNQIDQFSSILVKGERCWFKSFAETTAPTGSKSKTGAMIEGAKDMAKEKATGMAKEKAGEIVKDKAMDAAKGAVQ